MDEERICCARDVRDVIAELNKKGYCLNFVSTIGYDHEVFRVEMSAISPNSGNKFGKGIVIGEGMTEHDMYRMLSKIEYSMLAAFETEKEDMSRILDKLCELTKQGYQVDFNRLSITNAQGDKIVAGIRITLWKCAYSEHAEQLYVCEDLESRICDILERLPKSIDRIIKFEQEREW